MSQHLSIIERGLMTLLCHLSDKPQYYGKPTTFDHTVKKLHRQQKNAPDEAGRTIASQPEAGETKVGDLAGVQVYKFRMGPLWCQKSHESNASPLQAYFTAARLRPGIANLLLGATPGRLADPEPGQMECGCVGAT